mmetsp:Transcript_36552/g.90998  ORF Transcript_36552/g.90998 Transcript_36552/m.90998 type:complete len:102 (+) Transcript_36552:105-410(+)
MDGAIRQQITMLNSRFGLILIYGLRHNAKPTAFDMSFSVLAQSRSAPSCGQIWYEERAKFSSKANAKPDVLGWFPSRSRCRRTTDGGLFGVAFSRHAYACE